MTVSKRRIRESLSLALSMLVAAGLGLALVSWLAYALGWVHPR